MRLLRKLVIQLTLVSPVPRLRQLRISLVQEPKESRVTLDYETLKELR